MSTQAHRLADDLRMNCMFGLALQFNPDSVYGNAILSRFPLTRRRQLPLPRGSLQRDDGSRMPGQTEPRLALAATVCPPFGGSAAFDFLCVCTHIGKYNSAELDTMARVPGDVIGDFVCNEDYRDMPAILAGDFNSAWGDGPPFTGVVQRLERDWGMYPSAGTRPGKDESHGFKIDFVCDRAHGRWRMEAMETVRNEITEAASDHFPVLAVWQPVL